jgi:hypothetical protein
MLLQNPGTSCRGTVESCFDEPEPRHCEPTGRTNARPMTGSAKQSIYPLVATWIASLRSQ